MISNHPWCKGDCFLESVTAIRPEPLRTPTKEPRISDGAMTLATIAARNRDRIVSEIATLAGMPLAQVVKLLEELGSQSLIRQIQLCRSGRGGRPSLLALTPDGESFLREHGVIPLPRVLKGDDEHNGYGLIVARTERLESRDVTFEHTFGGAPNKTLDLTSTSRDASHIRGFEIAITGSAKHNADAAIRGASIRGLNELHVCASDKKLLTSIESDVAASNAAPDVKSKIQCRYLGDYVTRVLESIRA